MTCPSCRQDLPPKARFCSSCGTPCAAPAAPGDDERKPVTVLFCDLVGSTALSGVLDPETLRTVTLRYFEAMSERIVAQGGTPEKFIGDAVMAVFGVPVVREDDARRALAAALGMREALDRLNEELHATLGIRLATRVGVNTGQVVAGGDATARQALVSGETVNIAARLEQNAAAGEILIGPDTLRAAGPTVSAEPTGPLRLKGKRDSVEAYRLLALGTDDPAQLRRFDVPFVGRGAERDALDAALAATVRDGRAGLLRVTGEAGVGKTRLVREWLARGAASGALAYGAGRCRSHGEQGTLTPLADALRALPALTGEPPEAAGAAADEDARALLSAGLLRDGTPNAPFDDMCAALSTVLERAARLRPVVLVLDDAHAAAPLLTRTLERLTAGSGPPGVLLVQVGRPDGTADTTGALPVTGLPRDEAARLAALLARLDGRDGPVDERLLARAEGNPLYLEQLLVDGRADGAGGTGADAGLPPTLQALLGARIGALARAERTVVDLAAVIGREFTAAELVLLEVSARLAERRPSTVVAAPPQERARQLARAEEVLAALSRRRLVEPAPRPGPETSAYRFSSGLVHEVTYGSLSKRAKADRHAWAAELPSVLRAGDGAVGGHLERAYRYRAELGLLDDATRRLRGRAAAALGRAGAQAAARSDLPWAHSLLERAAGLDPDDAGVVRRLGEVRVALGDTEAGAELLRRVRDLESAPLESAHARLALVVLDPGGPGPGLTATARAVLPVFEEAGDSVGRARAHLRLAQRLQQAGRHEEAERDQARALEQAELAGAEPERAGALGAIGISLWRGPVPAPEAVRRCRALLAAHGVGRPTVRLTLNCPLAVLYALQDRPADAYGCLAEAEELARKLGFAEAEVFLPVFRAAVESLVGHGSAALELLVRADEAARHTGAAGMRTAVALDAARIELDSGRTRRAAARLAAIGEEADLSHADAVDLRGMRGRLSAAEGRPFEAVVHADRAVAASLLTDSPLVQATAELDRARTLSTLGRWADARASARTAREHYASKGHLPGVRAASGCVPDGPAPDGTALITRERS
ncbi:MULTISPECIES: adenylate/guanylate cyclase domain-containing protein [Streptomyces]|uniref:adenylate/guanylate cyclase domain-containing protein n=1 Tax=Streptomyces TaxID=1883 RepID=UPI00048ACE06|nr:MULTISPECIES: adenylate/guanylate cyclase domain-containing protein [unclassified Streptomyces]MYQ53105.1 AAA family ATPase [Streptomyces sp. SID4941]MYY18081.1 AAA family ATPase [Streptomyces sp. SID4912]SCD39492.1 AAA ATPase domain-containing protein [Streptomyces sp. DpondAA-D4]SCD97962.1 AAA ATPase domain-containing protein [Streptomyces sp. PalvLS-984]SDD10455.1 AAA ATPase domain-containing protein [Streptomyces sp. AmelKG-A3]